MITGCGRLLTTKLTEFDRPPPGDGFVTITGYEPIVASSLAINEIVNCVALTNVAVCPTPLYVTVEVDSKLVPLMVSICAAAPALAEEGERVVMLGTGLGGGGEDDPPPPPPAQDIVKTHKRRQPTRVPRRPENPFTIRARMAVRLPLGQTAPSYRWHLCAHCWMKNKPPFLRNLQK